MQQLTWTDAAFVRLESAATPIHVHPLLVYDPSEAPVPVTFTAILREIEARFGDAPSFRRRLVGLPFGLAAPYWVDDPDFDLEYHVRHIALPKPGDWRQLCIQVARLHARPLDLKRPPWEMTVIEGLDAVEGLPPGCFAIALKVHHAAVDGVEGVQLISAIHDTEPAPQRQQPLRPWRPESQPSTIGLMHRAAIGGAIHPFRAARVLVPQVPNGIKAVGRQLLDRQRGLRVPQTRFNGRVSPHRVFEASFHDFAAIRTIKNSVAGATVNDVALAYVGGALRHYLLHHHELPADPLVAACPISIRTPDQVSRGGNMLSAMRQSLGTDEADPLARLTAITAATSRDREARQGVAAPSLLRIAELLPGALIGIGARASSVLPTTGPPLMNTTVTNVPGSRVPLYFSGAKMLRSTGNGPLMHGSGLIHLVSTYVGDFSVAVTADRAMMPDPGFYAECMQRSFDELFAAATREELPVARGPEHAARVTTSL